MTITAKIIADSISEEGIRITSMQLRYPRFIHAELMTHRVFSRNASSSRAVPVSKLIEDIIRDTAMPIHWGKNQKGMQADEEHNALVLDWYYEGASPPDNEYYTREEAWFDARDYAIKIAKEFDKAGYHKQNVNRLLEPFSHINVLVTATSYDNFYELRRHKDAQPEIHELADRMFEAMADNEPTLLKEGEWHLPYITTNDYDPVLKISDYAPNVIDMLIMCSVARCARVSYLTFDAKEPTIENDLKLYNQLVGSVPLHASPAEHQATPDEISRSGQGDMGWKQSGLHGNFVGWIQYRKILEKELNDKEAL